MEKLTWGVLFIVKVAGEVDGFVGHAVDLYILLLWLGDALKYQRLDCKWSVRHGNENTAKDCVE